MNRLNRRDFGRTALATIAYGLSKPLAAQPVNEPIDPANILWSADHEKGTFDQWSRSPRGISSGGNFSDSPTNNENLEVAVTDERPHRGKYAAYTKVKRAVKKTIGTRLLPGATFAGNSFPMKPITPVGCT